MENLTQNLTLIVTLLLALSIASERIAEIIKGYVPSIFKRKDNIKGKEMEEEEERRRSHVQILSIACGIGTTFLTAPVLPDELLPAMDGVRWISILALGLLSSGGSALWNAVLSYLLKVKDLKDIDLKKGTESVNTLQKKIREMEVEVALLKTGKKTA
jgi:hypothetical protein